MKGDKIDIDELKLENQILKLALQYLAYAISERKHIRKYLLNARKALQFANTLDEYEDDCECEGGCQ